MQTDIATDKRARGEKREREREKLKWLLRTKKISTVELVRDTDNGRDF